MPANYVLLERIELNTSAASVVFNNIPQSGYTDLKIVVSARMSGYAQIAGVLRFGFNGGSANQSVTTREIVGTGSGVGSSTTEYPVVNGGSSTSNVFNNLEVYIPNYTSNTNKSFSVDSVIENNATTSYQRLNACLWSNTAAINSINLTSDGNFDANSTFSLYGLAAVGTTPVIAPKATGGNITSDGTYWIHTFNSTGTFTPLQGLSCDYLVVAGGGGGGQGGAGGGAGGLRSTVGATGGGGSLESALSVSAQAYTITVGAGGAGGTGITTDGSTGSNSVFSTITATGGGGGASYGNSGRAGLTGGSGGGSISQNNTGVTISGGSGTANQGYAGGSGTDNGASPNYFGAGGGGGAGAVGGNGTTNTSAGTSVGGNGGNGVATSISGTSVTYAGGGGGFNEGNDTGAEGGTGGGGNGRDTTHAASAGTANRGGGGGGENASNAGGAGGSGIVVIRYLVA